MGKAFILALVAVATGLLIYWLLGGSGRQTPLTPRPPGPSTGQSSGAGASGSPTSALPAAPPSGGPIAPPRSAEQQASDNLAARRGPLYSRLRQDLRGYLVAVRPSDDDAATLDLYAVTDDPNTAARFLGAAVRADVSYYGFRHIRFFLPNPPDAIERFRLDAEATEESPGNWRTFKE